MITGLVEVLNDGPNAGLGEHWMRSPKVILATCVWIVYALALHTPMNTVVRGRRSAVLSIVGFALMFGTLIAVQFMPKGQ
jgi:ABC-type transport system involved in cytochrome c biogenesis permease subunit